MLSFLFKAFSGPALVFRKSDANLNHFDTHRQVFIFSAYSIVKVDRSQRLITHSCVVHRYCYIVKQYTDSCSEILSYLLWSDMAKRQALFLCNDYGSLVSSMTKCTLQILIIFIPIVKFLFSHLMSIVKVDFDPSCIMHTIL